MNDYFYCAFLIRHNFKTLLFSALFIELRYVYYDVSEVSRNIVVEPLNDLQIFHLNSPYIFDIIQKIDEEE